MGLVQQATPPGRYELIWQIVTEMTIRFKTAVSG